MDKSLFDQLIASTKIKQVSSDILHVDKRLASYIQKYEKLRNIVGFHEEHVWRRYAIERIIRRKLFISQKEQIEIRDLLQELVLANYIRESDITEESITSIEAVVEKHMRTIELVKVNVSENIHDIEDWFFGIMAVEIEDALQLLEHEKALMRAMEHEMKKTIEFPKYYLSKEQEDAFITITTCRVLLRSDQEFIAYILMGKWYGAWFHNHEEVATLGPVIWNIRLHIRAYESHPLYHEIAKIFEKYAVVFWTLDETIKKYHGNIADIGAKAKVIVNEIYFSMQHRINSQVWHTFIYFLITKLIFISILEIPYDLWRYDTIHMLPVGINLTVPVLLLLILTVGARVGNEANTKLIVSEVERLMYGGESALDKNVELPKNRTLSRSVLFNIIFFIAYLVSYGAIVYFLYRMNFSPVGGFLFVWFVTLVPYLSTRIRLKAERFRIVGRRMTVGGEVLYFFALPLLSTGHWLIRQVSRYNLFLIIFDLILEAPYKTLVFLFRDFSDFAREKREMIK